MACLNRRIKLWSSLGQSRPKATPSDPWPCTSEPVAEFRDEYAKLTDADKAEIKAGLQRLGYQIV